MHDPRQTYALCAQPGIMTTVILGARVHEGLARALERIGFDAYARLVLNEEGDPAIGSDGRPVEDLKLRVKKGLYTLEMLRCSLCEVRGEWSHG